MDRFIKRLGDAYHKYSINPCEENLKILQELTGREDMQDVFDATATIISEATDIEGLEALQHSVNRLHKERSLLLQDQRIQAQARRRLNPQRPLVVNQHLQALRESIKSKIHQLHREDKGQQRLELKLFGLCCRRYQEKIRDREASILGPHAYEIAGDEEFQQDAKALNQISEMADPKEKLAFLDDHLNMLQDKYLPGKVVHEKLCQLLIITLSQADNPHLLRDIELVEQSLTLQQRQSNLGAILKAASVAVYIIQREALPDIPLKTIDSNEELSEAA